MARRTRFTSCPRWLLPLLVLFLVLGHVCELPTYSHLVMSSHGAEGAAGHSGHDHPDPQISCDAIDVVSNTGPVHVGPNVGVMEMPRPASPAPLRLVTSLVEDSRGLPSRPPLFLLYASLLI
jgi:hypothetical protein